MELRVFEMECRVRELEFAPGSPPCSRGAAAQLLSRRSGPPHARLPPQPDGGRSQDRDRDARLGMEELRVEKESGRRSWLPN